MARFDHPSVERKEEGRPQPAKAGQQMPRGAATLLQVQRLAGNQAAVALMRQSDPAPTVVQRFDVPRPWKDSKHLRKAPVLGEKRSDRLARGEADRAADQEKRHSAIEVGEVEGVGHDTSRTASTADVDLGKSQKDDPGSYNGTILTYVKQANKDHAAATGASRELEADYAGVLQSKSAYDALETKKSEAKPEGKAAVAKKQRAIITELREVKPGLGGEEVEQVRGVIDRAGERHQRANSAMAQIVRERALLEHFSDLAQEKRNELREKELTGEIGKRSGRAKADQAAGQERTAGIAAMRGFTQEVKLSANVVSLKRRQTETDRDHVKKKIGRLPGALRKVVYGVAGGIAGAIVQIFTLGIASAEANKDERGFIKSPLPSRDHLGAVGTQVVGARSAKDLKSPINTLMGEHGPIRLTLLNNLKGRIRQFRNEAGMRRGQFVWDKVSAVLGFFNEAVIQNMINVLGAAGTWLTVLGLLTTVVGGALTLGATTPITVALTAAGLVLAAAGLAGAAVKALINTFRAAAGLVSALWNQDAKVQAEMNARSAQTGLDAAAAWGQVPGKALGVASGGMSLGGVTTGLSTLAKGAFDAGKGGAIGLSVASGPLAGAVAAAGSTQQSAWNNDKGNLLKGADAPAEQGGMLGPVPDGPLPDRPREEREMPAWMRAAQEKQTAQRGDALRSRVAVAKGEATLVNTRVKEFKLRLQSLFSPLLKVTDFLRGKGKKAAGADAELAQVVEDKGNEGTGLRELTTEVIGASDDVAPHLSPANLSSTKLPEEEQV